MDLNFSASDIEIPAEIYNVGASVQWTQEGRGTLYTITNEDTNFVLTAHHEGQPRPHRLVIGRYGALEVFLVARVMYGWEPGK